MRKWLRRAIGLRKPRVASRTERGAAHASIGEMIGIVHADVVINCVGVVKQLASAEDPLVAIPLKSLLPHRLPDLAGAPLVHISTDCVFNGSQGFLRRATRGSDRLNLKSRG